MFPRTPGNSKKGLIPKIGFLSGRLCAKFVRTGPGLPSHFKNLSGHPDQGIFWPRNVRIGGSSLSTGSNNVERLGNGYITSKMYILTLNDAIGALIIGLLSSSTLFREFQGCRELFLTVFQIFITKRIKILDYLRFNHAASTTWLTYAHTTGDTR
jgi:hypothetical protein